MKVEGLSGLHAQLSELKAELAQKALTQAARKAFKPVLERAQALVPVDTGDLRNALKLTVVKPKTGNAVVVVGIRIAAKRGEDGMPPARRWHFIELGTAKLPASPFLRPALDSSASEVLQILKEELAKSIARALKKGGKK